MSGVPEPIRRRLAGWVPPRPPVDRPVAPGDVRRMTSGGVDRLVAIVGVPAHVGAQVALIHPYPEYATGDDVVVDPSVTGVRYPIVVQPGVRGVVRLTNLGPLVATVPDEVVSACVASRPVALTSAGLYAGTAFTGPLEARAAFKAGERATLGVLCEETP